MRKLCIAALSLFAHTTYALPIGNPTEVSQFCCKSSYECCWWDCFEGGVGFYGDYVFNRHMKTVKGKDIDTTQLFTNAAYLAITCDGFGEVFSTLGISRLVLNTSLGAFNAADRSPLFAVESNSAFSYSIGGRATPIEYHSFSLGIEGQYFVTQPSIKRLYIASGAVSYPNDLQTRYSEWQIGMALSYFYNDFFIPYAGVKYARSYWKFDNGKNFIIETNTGTFLHNMRNQRHLGYAIGLTLAPPTCERLAVTVEARFLEEKALYLNALMQF